MQIRNLDYTYNKVVQAAQKMPGLLRAIGVAYQPSVEPVEVPPTTFASRSFDVTSVLDLFCSRATLTLTLGPEEVVVDLQHSAGNINRAREYADLGHVTRVRRCGGCFGVSSNAGTFYPGWGCSGDVVSAVIQEMRERMFARGNVGQIKKQEAMMAQLVEVNKEMQLVCDTLNLKYPPSAEDMANIYGSNTPSIPPEVPFQGLGEQVALKSYDVGDSCDALDQCVHTCGLSGWTRHTLELRENEMVMLEKNRCIDMDVKVPYAQLGSVDYHKACWCCYSINTGPQMRISPGWGCNQALTQEIAAELQERKVKRGNIAQLKQLEWMSSSAIELDIKSDLWLHSRSLQFPPNPQIIQRMYGSNPPRALTSSPGAPHLQPSKSFEVKSFDVTNTCNQICCCMFSLGLAGCVKTTLVLEEEEAFSQSNSWCHHSGTRRPYAHLASVDVEESCGCCYAISGVASPGCGCNQDLVAEIAAELQERKVKRGNIAQLMIQENITNKISMVNAKIDTIAFDMSENETKF
mmetsp:Transcript_37060/g.69643  ORF Transcript_37060/g.69643 Transcript_37060/m.69643 type:complete len:520 (+) Transcript_37060:2-1561(+)